MPCYTAGLRRAIAGGSGSLSWSKGSSDTSRTPFNMVPEGNATQ